MDLDFFLLISDLESAGFATQGANVCMVWPGTHGPICDMTRRLTLCV
jgi:hypothetical protein